MPQRSKIFGLPETTKKELDKKLICGGFSDYVALSTWLAEQGYEVSKSSLHRYGSEFEERLAAIKIATEQAQAIACAVEDDAGAMSDALTRLVQEKTFQLLVKMEDPDPERVDLNKMGIMISRLTRASVSQKKWMVELRKKTEKAIETVEKKLTAAPIDPDTLRKVREDIYGIIK